MPTLVVFLGQASLVLAGLLLVLALIWAVVVLLVAVGRRLRRLSEL